MDVIANKTTPLHATHPGEILKDETSHPMYSGHRRLINGEFHVAIKKQIINT